MNKLYQEPEKYTLNRNRIKKFDLKTTAFVIIDPQNDFLSESGKLWAAVGNNVKENHTVENLTTLFEIAKKFNIRTFISPHYYFNHDLSPNFQAPGEQMMHDNKCFYREEIVGNKFFCGSGADWVDIYKPYINSENTTVCSPHKVFGPQTNDLVFQLRKKGINTILLAGMSANLCVDSHLRDLIENGFEVIVIKDATAGTQTLEGDGYLSALVNWRIIANDIMTTEQVVSTIQTSL